MVCLPCYITSHNKNLQDNEIAVRAYITRLFHQLLKSIAKTSLYIRSSISSEIKTDKLGTVYKSHLEGPDRLII